MFTGSTRPRRFPQHTCKVKIQRPTQIIIIITHFFLNKQNKKSRLVFEKSAFKVMQRSRRDKGRGGLLGVVLFEGGVVTVMLEVLLHL